MKTFYFLTVTLICAATFGLYNVINSTQLIAQSVQQKNPARSSQYLPEVIYDPELLPEKVAETRKLILEAARSGDIETLRPVLESNEILPIISLNGVDDPIAHWKSQSSDGNGHEILAKIVEIFEAGFVRINKDTSEELYLWPYFAEVPLNKLTPTQKVELYQLLSHSDIKAMERHGKYNDIRAGIDRAGVWHFFVSGG